MRGPLQGSDVVDDIEEELRKKRKTANIDFAQVLPGIASLFLLVAPFLISRSRQAYAGLGWYVLIILGKRLI